MTQAKLEELYKIDNESYNLLRVLHMFLKLDNTQEVPLQAMAVFWYVATYQNCSKKDIEEHFKMSKASASRMTDYISRYHRLGKAGLGLISKEQDPKDKRKVRIYLTKKGIEYRKIASENVKKFNETVFSKISKDELDSFYKVMDAIDQSIEELKK